MKLSQLLRCWLLASVMAAPLFAADTASPRIFLIGGSTMATFPPGAPKPGWGQMLPRFCQNAATVRNHARSGRSSKSFINDGFWDTVIGEIGRGDYLIIHFGTNDSKKEDPKRFTEPRGEFKGNLERFIREARAKGAIPILATSLARRAWDAEDHFIDDHSEYVVVTREVAAAQRVPLLELRERSMELERSLGPEGSRKLHAHYHPGEHPGAPDGLKDDTHYNAHGALQIARLAVAEMRRLNLPLVPLLVPADRDREIAAPSLTNAPEGASRAKAN